VGGPYLGFASGRKAWAEEEGMPKAWSGRDVCILAVQAHPDTPEHFRRRCWEDPSQSGAQEAKQHAMEGERHFVKGREPLWGCSLHILTLCPQPWLAQAKEGARLHSRSCN